MAGDREQRERERFTTTSMEYYNEIKRGIVEPSLMERTRRYVPLVGKRYLTLHLIINLSFVRLSVAGIILICDSSPYRERKTFSKDPPSRSHF